MSLSDRVRAAVNHQQPVSVPFAVTLHAQAQSDAVEAVVTAVVRRLVRQTQLHHDDIAKAMSQHLLQALTDTAEDLMDLVLMYRMFVSPGQQVSYKAAPGYANVFALLRTRLRAVRHKGGPEDGTAMDYTQIASLEVLRHCLNELDFRHLVANETEDEDQSMMQAPWRRLTTGRKWWQESCSRSRVGMDEVARVSLDVDGGEGKKAELPSPRPSLLLDPERGLDLATDPPRQRQRLPGPRQEAGNPDRGGSG